MASARNVISGVFEYAIEEELLTKNPARGILRRLGIDEHAGRSPAQPMTPKEIDLFLDTCLKYEAKWHPFFYVLFEQGCG